jgi:hypothetical protein
LTKVAVTSARVMRLVPDNVSAGHASPVSSR